MAPGLKALVKALLKRRSLNLNGLTLAPEFLLQEQGLFGAVKNYIPGMGSPAPQETPGAESQDADANQQARQQQGSQGGK